VEVLYTLDTLEDPSLRRGEGCHGLETRQTCGASMYFRRMDKAEDGAPWEQADERKV